MTIIVQSSMENVIALPVGIMESLDLREGEEIKTVIEGQTLRLASVEKFLALRGALKHDREFDTAITYLNQEWQEWILPGSV
jgi:antitoxin component of MazEF toxin-antitoxin module